MRIKLIIWVLTLSFALVLSGCNAQTNKSKKNIMRVVNTTYNGNSDCEIIARNLDPNDGVDDSITFMYTPLGFYFTVYAQGALITNDTFTSAYGGYLLSDYLKKFYLQHSASNEYFISCSSRYLDFENRGLLSSTPNSLDGLCIDKSDISVDLVVFDTEYKDISTYEWVYSFYSYICENFDSVNFSIKITNSSNNTYYIDGCKYRDSYKFSEPNPYSVFSQSYKNGVSISFSEKRFFDQFKIYRN